MQYRTDPKSGNRLSALGFGCMRFPPSGALREELIVTAVQSGINYFDTAYVYPGSENALGAILKKNGLREKVFIADKLPHGKCKTKEDMDRLFGESLSRLQTDYIDYYLIHNLSSEESWERLAGLGVKDWIAEKKAAGKIRAIGFSFHGKAGSFRPLLDAYDWDFCQIQYNYMNESHQAGTAGLLAIHEKGMAAIIMEPLLGGRLGKDLPGAAKELFDSCVPGRTPAAWGFKWLWDKPEVTVVLSGMNQMAQLTENIAIAADTPAGSLTEEERAVYGEAYEAVSRAYKVPCTGCNYCMPCPHGVNIPGSFMGYNLSYTLGYFSGLQAYISTVGGMTSPPTGPSKCTRCGVCLEKCPQNIQIPDRLAEAQKRMEPVFVRAALAVIRKFIS